MTLALLPLAAHPAVRPLAAHRLAARHHLAALAPPARPHLAVPPLVPLPLAHPIPLVMIVGSANWDPRVSRRVVRSLLRKIR